MPHSGRGAWLALGEESTWGTPVSVTHYMRAHSFGLTRQQVRRDRAHLAGVSGAINRRSDFLEREDAGGPIEVGMEYRGVGMLLKHALGGLAESGGGPYQHDFTLGTIPTGLTLIGGRGTGTEEKFEGGRISRLELSIAAGQQMVARCDVLAQTASARDAHGTTTPSYGTDAPVLHHHAGQFSFNGNSFDLIDGLWVVDRKLARRNLLGSALTHQPVEDDFTEVFGRFTLEWGDDNLYTDYLAGTASDAAITFTGTGNDDMTITLHNGIIRSLTDPVERAGVLRQTVEIRAFSDGTDEGIKVTINNDDSTGIIN